MAETRETAEIILDEIIGEYGAYDIGIGVPEPAGGFAVVLREHRFAYRAPSLRMYLGEPRNYESSLFGIASPEKG